MALIFSTFLWPPEPLLQYPFVRAQASTASIFWSSVTQSLQVAEISANIDCGPRQSAQQP